MSDWEGSERPRAVPVLFLVTVPFYFHPHIGDFEGHVAVAVVDVWTGSSMSTDCLGRFLGV